MNYDDLDIDGVFPVPDLLLHEYKQRRDSLLHIHTGGGVLLIMQLHKREEETGRRLSSLMSVHRRQEEREGLGLLDGQMKSSAQYVYALSIDQEVLQL